jgi:hypothetical protein
MKLQFRNDTGDLVHEWDLRKYNLVDRVVREALIREIYDQWYVFVKTFDLFEEKHNGSPLGSVKDKGL